MTVMDFPTSPTNGQTTTDGRYYFDSSVGSTGAWRSAPLPVGGLPAGSIMAWGTNTPPANWLLADGSAVSRSTYSSLFAVIGIQYGAGDGTTTFNLPDLRGRVPVGKNTGTFSTLGWVGGAETHTLTTAQMPSHTHIQNAHTHVIRSADGGYQPFAINKSVGGSSYFNLQSNGVTNNTNVVYNDSTTATNQAEGGNQAHNNLQPYQVVNYIIKASAGWTAGDSELATRLGVVEQRQILSPNYLINGGFDIWQRGTSVTNSNAYLADRWYVTTGWSGGQCNQSLVTTTVQGKIGNALRVSNGVNATSVVEFAVRQPIERGHMEPLAGKTVTLSFWYRSNKTGTHGARIIGAGSGNPGGVDWTTSFTVSSADTWQRYAVTSSVPFGGITGWGSSNPTVVGAYVDIGLKVGNSGPGFTSVSASDYFEITGVQLEEGSVATPFRRNASSIQGELAACQRYLEYGSFKHYFGATSSYIVGTVNYKVNKRATPTITTSTGGSRAYIPAGQEWNELDGFCSYRVSSNEMAYLWKSECEL